MKALEKLDTEELAASRRTRVTFPRLFLVIGWLLNRFEICQPAFAKYLSSPFHACLYRTAARGHPYIRSVIAAMVMLAASRIFLRNSADVHPAINFAFLCMLSLPAVLIICSGYSVPNRSVSTIQHELLPANTIALHMGQSIPEFRELAGIVLDAVDGAKRIGYDRIELRSPIFGTPEALNFWAGWMVRKIRRVCPMAKVEILDRKPMGWYASGRYLALYGGEHVRVLDGRLQAARIVVSGFGS